MDSSWCRFSSIHSRLEFPKNVRFKVAPTSTQIGRIRPISTSLNGGRRGAPQNESFPFKSPFKQPYSATKGRPHKNDTHPHRENRFGRWNVSASELESANLCKGMGAIRGPISQSPSGTLFSFCLGRFPFKVNQPKKGCPFFPMATGHLRFLSRTTCLVSKESQQHRCQFPGAFRGVLLCPTYSMYVIRACGG